jgi:hypothetical protein
MTWRRSKVLQGALILGWLIPTLPNQEVLAVVIWWVPLLILEWRATYDCEREDPPRL